MPNYGDHAGFGQEYFPDIVLGPPQGEGASQGSLDVLSLGVGGSIAFDFSENCIVDGEGSDFIVFENPFFVGGEAANVYSELAQISVSENGETWQSFPCDAEHPNESSCAGIHPVFTNPDNGISPFDPQDSGGDLFDLAELGLSRACYLRIQDLSESGQSPSAGFDLDAIATLHRECL
ncbi:MAG: hypothetical protein IPJ88_09370 [Myxococcales bacterium]|nr:MAG: hypothetical protein IPJ88_09370 [Myxococcales bacterium]